MNSSGKDFKSVAVLPDGEARGIFENTTKGRNLSGTEKKLIEYFSSDDSFKQSDILFDFCTAEAHLYPEEKDLVFNPDKGDKASIEYIIDKWLRECEKSDRRVGFKSIYKVLSAIEKSGSSDGELTEKDHTKILKSAVKSAVSSSMSAGEKFVALAGLLKFTGASQQREMNRIIAPEMSRQLKNAESSEICILLAQAYCVQSWDLSEENNDEGFVIDGVTVSREAEIDFMTDFKKGNLGNAAERLVVRKALISEVRENPLRLLPLSEAKGQDGVEYLLRAMELSGDISEDEEKNTLRNFGEAQLKLQGNAVESHIPEV